MKKYWKLFVNPFERIAGLQALAWGIVGQLIALSLGWMSGYHYLGLLQYGPGKNPAWWCHLGEALIIWLVPALLFYLGGLLLSRSKIRLSDVLGTTLFAQLPLLFMGVIGLLPPMQAFLKLNLNQTPQKLMEIMQTAEFQQAMMLSLLTIPAIVLMLVWMFRALKVSCNLKGGRLWTVYLIGVLVGDVLCRGLIVNLLG